MYYVCNGRPACVFVCLCVCVFVCLCVRVCVCALFVHYVYQVRECALRLMHFAKATGAAVCITGHVNKSGDIAGPRTLEHLVDATLMLEADDSMTHRLLRCTKNRFGSSSEVCYWKRDLGPDFEWECVI